MNDTELRSAPITLDRRLVLGDTDYQVTAFPTDDHRIDLCIVSSDADGQVVSEISGGIAPADLAALTDVLTSTLAGLIAMTRPPASARNPPHADGRSRSPNQGARWTTADDNDLLTRYRTGGRRRDLADEFGRSPGAIRARLERLGELTPGAPWGSPPATTSATTPAPGPAPASGPGPDSATEAADPGQPT